MVGTCIGESIGNFKKNVKQEKRALWLFFLGEVKKVNFLFF